jgi:methylenetetrahydrofolate reductase (NADPH)
VIGLEISRLGIDPIIHFTCKDKNRNQIESILYSLDRIGISNLLVMTGDFPLYGFEGKAKPVFDLDSIHLLHLIHQMNEGLEIDGDVRERLIRLPIEEALITNTLPQITHKKIRILDITPIALAALTRT